MRTNIFIWLILFATNLVSQNPKIENFEIQNFKIDEAKSSREKSGINAVFDIKMISEENYFSKPYYFYAVLYDVDDKIIYSNSNNYLKLYPKPSFDENNYSIYNLQRHFIAYAALSLTAGTHKIKYKLYVASDLGEIGLLFEKEIIINVPILYNYDDQEFKINKLQVQENYEKYSQKGIFVSFICDFKFFTYQIKEYAELYYNANYYFYIKLLDTKSNTEYSINNPSFNLENIEVDVLSKRVEIFIPYNRINIVDGIYDMQVQLYASNYFNTINFGKLAETKFVMQQPKLYMAKFVMNSMQIVYGEYDVTSTIGRLFSSKESNTGKGYPDVFWTFYLGSLSLHTSDVSENSFFAYSDSVYFRMIDADPIKFTVYDYDLISRNDFLGEFKIYHKKGIENITYTDKSFDNVKACNFAFYKYEMPYIDKKVLDVKDKNIDGTSGLYISLNCHANNLPENEKINITPLIIRDSLTINLLQHINYSENIQKYQYDSDSPRLEIFVPYYFFNNNDRLAFNFNFNNMDFALENLVHSELVKIPEIKDIAAKIDTIYDSKINGIAGCIINYNFTIPTSYQNDIGLNKIFFNLNLQDTDNNKSLNNELTSIETQADINKFTVNKDMKKQIFIPYYIFGESKKKQNLQITSQSFVNEIQTSDNSQDFYLTIEDNIMFKLDKINIKIKTLENYKDLHYVIRYANKELVRTDKISDIKITELSVNKNFVCNHKDDIQIELYATDKYGIETLIQSSSLPIIEMQKKNGYKLKSNKLVKKATISF